MCCELGCGGSHVGMMWESLPSLLGSVEDDPHFDRWNP